MEEKFNEGTPNRPEGERLLDATLVSIDLPLFMEQIKQEPSWNEKDRNAITVYKANGLRIVLIALHEGAELPEHTADGIISVQVLEGHLKFNADKQSVEITKGQMVALHERIPHSLLAVTETVFLLTLATKLEQNKFTH